jgi:hypothetical protein
MRNCDCETMMSERIVLRFQRAFVAADFYQRFAADAIRTP